MRAYILFAPAGLLLSGCGGGMGGNLASETDEPASCKPGGDPMQCYQDLQRQTQAETGMTPEQQQLFMQQQMQGGMGGGIAQPGMMPGMMPSTAPTGSTPRQQGEMTPQEEQEFLKKIETLQQQQTK